MATEYRALAARAEQARTYMWSTLDVGTYAPPSSGALAVVFVIAIPTPPCTPTRHRSSSGTPVGEYVG